MSRGYSGQPAGRLHAVVRSVRAGVSHFCCFRGTSRWVHGPWATRAASRRLLLRLRGSGARGVDLHGDMWVAGRDWIFSHYQETIHDAIPLLLWSARFLRDAMAGDQIVTTARLSGARFRGMNVDDRREVRSLWLMTSYLAMLRYGPPGAASHGNTGRRNSSTFWRIYRSDHQGNAQSTRLFRTLGRAREAV